METVEDVMVMASKTASPQRNLARIYLALFSVIIALLLASAGQAQEIAVQLDPAQSKIEFTLGSTLHTVEGTFKLKSGSVRYDPATGKMGGSIVVDATSAESGNAGRDRKMHREILESGKYPDIVLTPNRGDGTFNAKGPSRLDVSGVFSLHGQNHEITLPVEIQPAGRQITLTTHLTIPYIKWGLKNPSTFILRASDKVEIEIHAVGQLVGEQATR
jgi:polyisoprenoid-binding protein YceI